MTSKLVSTLPVWALVVVGVLLVGTIAPPSGYLRWLSIVLASAILAAFVIQLALPSKEGLVARMMVSVGGAVVLLAIATAVLLPLSA